jgi:hypothetical protein
MTEERPLPVVIRRLRARGEGDINMMSVSGPVSRSGLSNLGEFEESRIAVGRNDLRRLVALHSTLRWGQGTLTCIPKTVVF